MYFFVTGAQVVRGDFIIFFNQIFDALCKLSADSDANVQSAAHLLDRLVKVFKHLKTRHSKKIPPLNVSLFHLVIVNIGIYMFDNLINLYTEAGYRY